MIKHQFKFVFFLQLLLCFVFFLFIGKAHATLTLSQFLDQVKRHNMGYEAYMMGSDGYIQAADAGKMTVSINFYQDFEFEFDKTPRLNPLLDGNGNRTYTSKTGFKQETLFGLQYDVYQLFDHTQIQGQTDPTQVPLTNYFDTKYAVSLTQDLWSNLLGRETQATIKYSKATSLSSAYTNRFDAKQLLSQSEITYIKLQQARELVVAYRQALTRYQQFENWMEDRLKLNLVLDSDLYQAKSAVVESELNLRQYMNDTNSDTRSLNTARGRETDTVKEKLQSLSSLIRHTKKPTLNMDKRDDYLAAIQTEIATKNQVIEASEQIKPTLSVGAQAYIHSRSGTNFFDGFNEDEISLTTTVSLSVPLSIGMMKRVQQGYKLQERAAKLSLEYQRYYDLRQWDDLVKSLKENKMDLSLSYKLERAQFTKMRNEIAQHQLGLSTTYQVLTFMQDYINAQVIRINAQSSVLQVLANMKLYGGQL